MSRKQLFIIIGILAFACLCVAGLGIAGMAYVGNNFGKAINNASDPANAQKIASSIVDYSLPAGYKQIGMDMFVYKYVMLVPDPENYSVSGPMIMLMAYPPNTNLDEKQMQEQLQRTFANQAGQNTPMRVVETKTVEIRGKSTKVTVMEGGSTSEYRIRQWFTVFTGKNGLVMLMIQGDNDEWQEQLVNDFIASIK
jgi:hypothetical protein